MDLIYDEAREAERSYSERFLNHRYLYQITFSSIHRRLKEKGNFNPPENADK